MAKFLSKENLLSILTQFKTKMEEKIAAAMPTKLSDLTNDAGYIDDTAAQAKADATLQAAKDFTTSAIGNINQFEVTKVEALPEVAEAKEKTIYIVPIAGAEEGSNNVYDEYLLIDSKWEHLGTTEVDLSGYDTAEQVDAKISAATEVSFTIESAIPYTS